MDDVTQVKKPILCLDFDGVIHSYCSGWQGAEVVPDPPVDGALDFIREAQDGFRVAIYSSRSGQPLGIEAMRFWLHLQFYKIAERNVADRIMSDIEWPTEKPPAMVGIDDRVLTFKGSWPDVAELRRFQPWNKRDAAEAATEAKQAAKFAALRERVAMLDRRMARIKTEATDSYHMGHKNGSQHWATGLRDIENMADTALKDTTI